MAPEQLRASGGGLGYLGTAVDVWASGIMLLVMLVRGRDRSRLNVGEVHVQEAEVAPQI
jgi:serine/threonine protein kinase